MGNKREPSLSRMAKAIEAVKTLKTAVKNSPV